MAHNHGKQGACLFFPIGARCGGAERRLIRIFGALPEEALGDIKIYIHDIGLTDDVKKDIGTWSNGRAEYHKSIFQIVCLMAKMRLKWVCIASLGRKTVFVFIVSALLGYKRLFLSVHHKSSMLEFDSKGACDLFNAIVCLSSQVDTLYPYSLSVLKERYPNKPITLTPGAFTDMNKYNVANKEKVIVFASTLIKGKGLEILLDGVFASREVLVENGYKCYVCGIGALYGEAGKYISVHDLAGVVELAGYVDTANFLPRASIFCSLQAVTNYPSQSLLEAMASGCFCIVTNGGESSMMVDDTFGMLIDENSHAFAAALQYAVGQCESRMSEISCKAREKVLRDFTLERSLRHYENILSKGSKTHAETGI